MKRIESTASLAAASLAVPVTLLSGYFLGLSLRWGVVVVVLVLLPLLWRVRARGERILWQILVALLGAYPVVVFLVQLSKLRGGLQGIDFAIFTQVVWQYANLGQFRTSLVDFSWQHFLTHHFSPYLYGVGWLARVVGDSAVTLLILHSIAVGAIYLLLYRIAWERTKDRVVSALITALGVLLPAPRAGLMWEVRDEIFALPFLLGALLCWLRGRHRRAVGLLLVTMLFKETMFLAAAVFAVMASGVAYLQEGRKGTEYERWLYGVVFVVGIAGFLLYTKVLPWRVFVPTFSGFTRIASLAEQLQFDMIRKKVWWGVVTFGPLLPLVFVLVRDAVRQWREGARGVEGAGDAGKKAVVSLALLFLLPGMFIGFILISRFEPMFQPTDYYSVVPILLFLTAVVMSARHHAPPLIACGCLLAALPADSKPIPQQLVHLREPPLDAPLRAIIPLDSTVITGDFDAPLFIGHHRVIRLFHGQRSTMKFDYIVTRKHGPAPSATVPLSRFLRSWSEPCYEDAVWKVACAYPSMQAHPKSQPKPHQK